MCPDWAIFLKLSVIKFLTKIDKVLGDFLGWFEKHLFDVKTDEVTFGASFEKIGLLFISTSGPTAQHLVTFELKSP